ncbi:MAG: hypothetical protein G4V63_27690 [Candidatus Afipia apatlaquensis]|uniref:Uncharacterized protein n=1 Tax=Candidatus Afipia apatlaquensis TaxID=2712852 RepID=A0A7C9VRJ2_9BRAD|nr:hypothetical protein [Candidatus Afipia apatlaquensis]
MSMELYVLSDVQLPSIAAWQQAIDVDGFPLRLFTGRPFAELRGVLPVQLKGRQTAFECDHWNAVELMTELSDVDFGRRWKFVLAFRWTGNPYEGIAAYMAGGAYAKATGGIVFDCEEGKIISPERTGEIAGEIERDIPMIEEMVRRMTDGK